MSMDWLQKQSSGIHDIERLFWEDCITVELHNLPVSNVSYNAY